MPETFSICDLPNFFEAATEEDLWTYQIKPKYWRKSCLVDKVINVVQLLVQSDWETYSCC